MIMSRKVTSYWNAFRLDYKAVFSPSENERESENFSFMFVMYFLILFTCPSILFAFVFVSLDMNQPLDSRFSLMWS